MPIKKKNKGSINPISTLTVVSDPEGNKSPPVGLDANMRRLILPDRPRSAPPGYGSSLDGRNSDLDKKKYSRSLRSSGRNTPSLKLGFALKTIAFIANFANAGICAKLGEAMVEIGSKKFNFKDDSQHPNTLYLIDSDIQKSEKIADCYGCDIIVKINNGEIFASYFDGGKIDSWQINADKSGLEDLLSEISQKIISLSVAINEKPTARLKNVNYPDQEIKEAGFYKKEISSALQSNKNFRLKRLQESFSGEKNPVEKYDLLILGGAGPRASAKFLTDAVSEFSQTHDKKPSIVHLSFNGCPGKARYISGLGPSFLDHYRNAMDFFGNFVEKIVTPCNTNHIVMKNDIDGKSSGWATDYLNYGKIIDFRDALTRNLKDKEADKVVILGTTSTTSVDGGLYKNCLPGGDVLRASKESEEKIMTAIYDIKEGKLQESRKLIDEVIAECRQNYGKDTIIALACTELPLVYNEKELQNNGLICVSRTAIDLFKNLLESDKKKEVVTKNNDRDENNKLPSTSTNNQLTYRKEQLL